MKHLISEIEIAPVKPVNGLVAFASFVLWGSLYCGSVAVMTRPQGGYRLLYPTKKLGGRQLNIFYPIGREIGAAIESEVVAKLEDVMKDSHDRYSCAHTTSI